MVDKALIEEVKKMREGGESKKEDILKVFEMFKQVSLEDEDLKEEIEDSEIAMQFVITDEDYKFWLIAKGTLSYGEGDCTEDPTVTFSANAETIGGMFSGAVDATAAYMSGDLVIEGNLQDAMAFGEITSLAMEALEEYFD
jgi:putative sterol carrier protein